MTYLKMREVEQFTGLTRVEIWDRIKAGTFPKPVYLPPTGYANEAKNYWIQEDLTPSAATKRQLERLLNSDSAP